MCLFSVLYCGASTALPTTWTTRDPKGLDKNTIVQQLKNTHSASLEACQYLKHPTTSTLVSSLLAYSCSKPNVEPLEDIEFMSMVVSIAQSMGLHRDGTLFNFDPVTCELNRPVWWHIIWLITQTSIRHGSQISCGNPEEIKIFPMISKIRHDELFTNQSLRRRSSSPSYSTTSVTALLAIGRFESARFKHFVFNYLEDGRTMAQSRLNKCINAAKSLQGKLDSLIAAIPAQGIPETGVIPSRLANGSSITQEQSYGDHSNRPTVWGSWVRIMLTMLKSEAAILIQKPFSGRADSRTDQESNIWNRFVNLLLIYE